MENQEIIYRHQLPTNHLIIDKEIIKYTKKKTKMIQGRCPQCNRKKWISEKNLNSGHTQSSYCFDHKWIPRIKWATENEFIQNKKAIVYYDKQRIVTVGKKVSDGRQKLARNSQILAKCPDCQQKRWVLINGLRNKSYSTYCRICNASYNESIKGENNSQWKGGIQIINGYRTLNITHLKNILDITDQDFDFVIKYLGGKIHRNYLYEHRIIALLTYGPKAVQPGIVVRHLNGDKLDNRPENLELGTQSDNIRDHVADRNEVKLWKGLTMNLIRIILSH